jgi:uncharacterized protein (TIGR02099 family)
MRASRRRLWTWVLPLSAVALIVVVVAVAGFRMLVKAVPSYRDDIEQRVSTTLDRRVSIRELDLSWRRFRPSLDLLDVTLYGDDDRTPALKMRELNVSLDWLALFTARLRLAELRLAGLVLTVERLADGTMRVSGISSDKPLTVEDLRQIARAAERVGRIVVADSQVLWLDYTDPNTFHRIDDIDLSFSTRGDRHRLEASAQLPVEFGGVVEIEAKVDGELEQFGQLDVAAELRAQSLKLGAMLQPWLQKDTELQGGDAFVHLSTRWKDSRLVSAAGELSSGALQVRRGQNMQAFIEDTQAEFKVTETKTGGWRVLLDRLSMDAPARQPIMSRGSFEFRPATSQQGLWFSAALDRLRLDEFGDWLALFDLGEQAWLSGLQPVGDVQDLRLMYESAMPEPQTPTPTARYAMQARFENVGLSPEEIRPGVTGASGRVRLDQDNGELMLMIKNGQLLAPGTLDEPMPLAQLNGVLNWQRLASDWVLSAKDLRWHGPADLAGQTDFELKLFGAGGSPHINMDMQFASNSWAQVRSFFPRVPEVIDEEARHWIQTAIVDAQVSLGHVQLRGLLDHFPYQNPDEPGLFQIDFGVKEGIIDYAEGWPAIDRINGHVTFRGRSMLIDAKSARIIGTAVGPVRVEVKDFKTPLLQVKGDVAADAGKMLSFLPQSPLRTDYAGLVDALKLQGPAKLDLRLDIPLDDLEATQVAGVVSVDGRTQLNHAKLPEPITALTGQVRFSNDGLSARDLQGELLGMKLALQMDPEQHAGNTLTRLQASTEVAFPRDAARLAKLVPAEMLARLRGTSQLRANMLFDASATPAQLQLYSDLAGLWINLPPPFAKASNETLPLKVDLDPSAAVGMEAKINYGTLMSAALRLKDSQGRWTLERGHVHLGAGAAQLPAQPGLWVDGKLDEVDVSQWQAAFKPAKPAAIPATPATTLPAEGTPPVIRSVDVALGRLLVAEQAFENLRIKLAPENRDWLLSLNSPAVTGTVRWQQQPAGRTTYRAELKHLVLRAPEQEPDEAESTTASPAEPMDPSTLPGLSLNCHSLRVNEHDLGSLQIEAVPVGKGLSLSTLNLNGDLNVQGSGNWTRLDNKSSAQLSLSVRGSKLKQMFAALGYVPSLDAEKVKVQASLAWEPHAEGIKTEALGGGFSLDLEDGVMMAVEPGAGRVLGLLNFFALPRRLTLDFSDVISKGLAFDTLKGDFRLEQGNAFTDNLRVRGPSLRMEIAGRVGLAARDYDQKVTIHPQVSSGVALTGAALGGPAVGLGLLLAQQLFKKPLEELSELSYRLHGPWDNPSIDRDD